MSEQTGASVDCPICGEAFDPTAAGGWCTNPDCGEWQYEGGDPFPDSWSAPDVDDPDSDRTPDETRETGTHEGDDRDGSDVETRGTEKENGETPETPEAEGHADDGRPETVREDPIEEAGADPADTTEEVRAEPVDTTDDVPEEPTGGVREDTPDMPAEAEAESTDEVRDVSADDAPVDCPECGETLDADTNFCSSCGTDISHEPAAEQATEPELTACPGCGAEVEPGDNFCAVCGQDLEAARGGEMLTACPGCGAEVEPGDSFCASCGENLDARGGDAGGGGASDSGTLLLAARGEEIAVTDGDSVGRELRQIIMETGGDEDQAVRVHREHVRFLREDGQFYMVDLGTNPTRLNGQPLEKGDREPVSPGDEIELSGVIGIVIRKP